MSDNSNSTYPSNTDLSDSLSPLRAYGDEFSAPYTNTSEQSDENRSTEDINIPPISPDNAPQTATQDVLSDENSDHPSDSADPDDQSSKDKAPPEVKLQKQINEIYEPFSEIVSQYNVNVFWAPIIILIFAFLLFTTLISEIDLEMSDFLYYWTPALLPFTYALGGLGSKISCISDSEFEDKCRSYREQAIELNQIYADELRLPESAKAKDLPNFSQLQDVLNAQSPFDDAQAPLTPDEDARLDTYIRLRKGPYPCLAFKPHTSKSYKSYIIFPIISTLLSIALIAYITHISALSTTWTIISLVIYFLSFLGYFSYLKFIFTKHIKRISDPEYIDASQLYIRRFVQEFRNNS